VQAAVRCALTGITLQVADAPNVALKFKRQVKKLLSGLQEKYQDVPALSLEGQEEEEKGRAGQNKPSKTGGAKEAGNSKKQPDASAGGAGGGGKTLADWELTELQIEVDRRLASGDVNEEEEEMNYWLSLEEVRPE
jgi:hypothetical protein